MRWVLQKFLFPFPGLNRFWSVVLYTMVAAKGVICVILFTRLRPTTVHGLEELLFVFGMLMIGTKLLVGSAILYAILRRRWHARVVHTTTP